jgi:hypothetical protein
MNKECGLSPGDCFISGTGKVADTFQAILLTSVPLIDWWRAVIYGGSAKNSESKVSSRW